MLLLLDEHSNTKVKRRVVRNLCVAVRCLLYGKEGIALTAGRQSI